MKKDEEMAQLWLRYRFSEAGYRVWVVSSWTEKLGLGQNETKWEEVTESFPKFQSLSGRVFYGFCKFYIFKSTTSDDMETMVAADKENKSAILK